jgi:hypothetical protein
MILIPDETFSKLHLKKKMTDKSHARWYFVIHEFKT